MLALRVQMLKQGDSSSRQKNGWLLSLTDLTAKCNIFFVLIQENGSLERFYFQVNRKTLCFSKKHYSGISKIVLSLRDRHDFIWQSLEIFRKYWHKKFNWNNSLIINFQSSLIFYNITVFSYRIFLKFLKFLKHSLFQ